jgi:hypothetical protein
MTPFRRKESVYPLHVMATPSFSEIVFGSVKATSQARLR